MNVFHKVTLESLKKNKTRTIVTIIGVILSAAMICAVTTFASSFSNYALETAIYENGNWHGRVLGTEYHTYEDVCCTGDVKEAIYIQQLGYARLQNCENEYKPYLYVLGTEKNTGDVLPIRITSGRYPESNQEILLPDHLFSNGGIRYEIGDTVTLELGERLLDGYPMTQNNPIQIDDNGKLIPNSETVEIRESRTYQVVGFYNRFNYNIEDYSAPGYTALTLADKDPSAEYLYDIYFQMEKPKTIYDFMEKMGFPNDWNTDVLMYLGTSQYNSLTQMLKSLALIVIGLIMFGSVALIYNAFSISVSERTKQFGLLSSIGATKKQLAGMIGFEALAVSAIGIPVGILAGVGGIGVTLFFIGDKFRSMGFPISLKLHVSVLSIVAAAVIALVTVFISAWIPSKRARKVTAVEAIRQSEDIKLKKGDVKTSKLTYKIFGLPGVLARKYYKRSKRKYRATVLSLFMSIVLFVSASSFTNYLTELVEGGYGGEGYDLSLRVAGDELSEFSATDMLHKLNSTTGVTDVSYQQSLYVTSYIDPKYLTDQLKEYLGVQDPDSNFVELTTHVTVVDDDTYRAFLKEHDLDENQYMNPNAPMAVAIDGGMDFDYVTGRYEKVNYLNNPQCQLTAEFIRYIEGYSFTGVTEDEDGNQVAQYIKNDSQDEDAYLYLPWEQAFAKNQLQIGTVIYDRPFFTGTISVPILVYPMSLAGNVYEGFGRNTREYYYEFKMLSSNHNESYSAVKTLLDENGFDSGDLYDQAAYEDNQRNMITIIRVFSYGFIVLISLIAMANVFNTISTNISLRRREFAMLKSVGMTEKEFHKMMSYECLLYGTTALLYGLPVSGFVTYLIWKSIISGFSTEFRLPWISIGIAVFSVFAVVFATMVYAMSKIRKESVVENLKNENT